MRICDLESMLMNQNQGFESGAAINDLIQRDAEFVTKDREQYINHLQKAVRAVKLQNRGLQLDTRELHRRLLDAERQLASLKFDHEDLRTLGRELALGALEVVNANCLITDEMQVRKWRSRLGQKWITAADIRRVTKEAEILTKQKRSAKDLTALRQLIAKHGISVDFPSTTATPISKYSTQKSYGSTPQRSVTQKFGVSASPQKVQVPVQKILPFVASPVKEVSEIGILREQSLSSVDSKMESITSNDSDE